MATTAASDAVAAPAVAEELDNLDDVHNEDEFIGWLLSVPAALHVAFFYADWHEPSKQCLAVIRHLAVLHPSVYFARLNAEEAVEVSETLSVAVVPTVAFFRGKQVVDRLEGADVPELARRVERLAAATPATGGSGASGASYKTLDDLTQRLSKLVSASAVMVFMKGSPESPKCKYSRRMVDLLKATGVTFGSFDILTSQAVRQGLKDMFNWPTFPQLYVHGKLIGGVDIAQELQEAGELAAILPPPSQTEGAALKPLPTGGAAMAPAVSATSVTAGSAGSRGGDEFELTPGLRAQLQTLVSRSPAMLFMKGTPDDPACGFSDRMVQLLRGKGVPFDSFDILSNPDVRAGLKVMFDWPTYPQLYVHGALVGGLDIVKEMAAEAEADGTTLASKLGL